jgi:Na+:H+ antiporter, NhaA family
MMAQEVKNRGRLCFNRVKFNQISQPRLTEQEFALLKTIHSRTSEFIHSQSGGGIVLAVAALLALIVSNSPWSGWYEHLLQVRGEVRVGGEWLVLSKPLLVWINDLWMAVFFFLVGLEIKRELLEGELASVSQALLPAGAAFGGMLIPALIYSAINWGDAVALRGWAIPAATDIAFALGILVLLGKRVPVSLKVFLTAVAIIDDLGAIVIIAFFYTAQVSVPMLWAAGACIAVLFAMNRAQVMNLGLYVLVGMVVWLFVLKSGVHATLAGVVTALAVPLVNPNKNGHGKSPLKSPLKTAEHALHPWVAFGVLPVFAFANAGVSLQGVSFSTLLQTVPLGITAGLLLGKAVGVFGAAWLMIRFTPARLPDQANWMQFFGVCVLCGVGFTMSLFIGGLAFAGQGAAFDTQLKLGVLMGSVLSGVLGALILLRSRK